MNDTPSPWLARELRYEREARHARCARRVTTVQRIAFDVLAGGAGGATAVLALQFLGVLPK